MRRTTMAQGTLASRASSGGGSARVSAAPEVAVRLVGVLLALAIAAVHIADQGGVTSLASPHWMGWGFRLIEAGGALTAIALLVPWSAWLGWGGALLLGTGPFVGYVTSRT